MVFGAPSNLARCPRQVREKATELGVSRVLGFCHGEGQPEFVRRIDSMSVEAVCSRHGLCSHVHRGGEHWPPKVSSLLQNI